MLESREMQEKTEMEEERRMELAKKRAGWDRIWSNFKARRSAGELGRVLELAKV